MTTPIRKPRFLRTIECQRCGTTVTRSGFPKYCEPCSEIASAETQRKSKAAYAERNAENILQKKREHARASRPKLKESTLEAGKALSEAVSLSGVGRRPEYEWIVRFRVPFTYAASKNHIYGWGHHIHKRAASRKIQDAITLAAKSALRGINVVNNKVWIGLHVEKTNHKGDAVNVLDFACDGLKEAIGVDDRWFCIDHLDWTINKNDPHIIIQIAQEALEHAQACSSCGRILPLTDFGKKAGTRNGVDRNCIQCRRMGRSIARKQAEPAA